MSGQTALKTTSTNARELETERLERLRQEVQKIVDARKNREISEDEALERIAALRKRNNSFLGSIFHRSH